MSKVGRFRWTEIHFKIRQLNKLASVDIIFSGRHHLILISEQCKILNHSTHSLFPVYLNLNKTRRMLHTIALVIHVMQVLYTIAAHTSKYKIIKCLSWYIWTILIIMTQAILTVTKASILFYCITSQQYKRSILRKEEPKLCPLKSSNPTTSHVLTTLLPPLTVTVDESH